MDGTGRAGVEADAAQAEEVVAGAGPHVLMARVGDDGDAEWGRVGAMDWSWGRPPRLPWWSRIWRDRLSSLRPLSRVLDKACRSCLLARPNKAHRGRHLVRPTKFGTTTISRDSAELAVAAVSCTSAELTRATWTPPPRVPKLARICRSWRPTGAGADLSKLSLSPTRPLGAGAGASDMTATAMAASDAMWEEDAEGRGEKRKGKINK